MDAHLAIVETTEDNNLSSRIKSSLTRAISEDGKLVPDILAMEGMSGKKYRIFINNLIENIPGPRYLEIGVWQGSTLCSAIYDNNVQALAIDNWSQFGGVSDKFFANISRFKGPKAALSFFDSDYRKVNFDAIGKFNVYMFDGPHGRQDQHDGVTLAQPALDDQFVLIVDDWNWKDVRQGTFEGIRETGLRMDFAAEIRTTLDDTHANTSGAASDWHNGYFIAACSKT
jgi:hypothetical protein